jgi:hypothetical protein
MYPTAVGLEENHHTVDAEFIVLRLEASILLA